MRSAVYWENRYRSGRGSGIGSYGKLAAFKSEVINNFIKEKGVRSLIDLGCGDGNQLGLFKVSSYLGLDVSRRVIEICSERYKEDETKKFVFVEYPDYSKGFSADLVISLDVIFHLVENDAYFAYMRSLFQSAKKFVIIYSSNFENFTAPHERERKFTDYVGNAFPQWRLVKKIDNPWPYPKYPKGSYSDFYIYERRDV